MLIPLPGTDSGILGQMDFLIHYAMYLVLAGYTIHMTKLRARGRVFITIIYLFLLAGGTEFSQFFLISRNFDLMDLLINIAGVLAGILLGYSDSGLVSLRYSILNGYTLLGLAGGVGLFGKQLFELFLHTRSSFAVGIIQLGSIIGCVCVCWIRQAINEQLLFYVGVESAFVFYSVMSEYDFFILIGGVLISFFWILQATRFFYSFNYGVVIPLLTTWIFLNWLPVKLAILQTGGWVLVVFLVNVITFELFLSDRDTFRV